MRLDDGFLDIRRRFIDTCKKAGSLVSPNLRELAVGLLSYHGWENRCHKLSFTRKRLSRIFYNQAPLNTCGPC